MEVGWGWVPADCGLVGRLCDGMVVIGAFRMSVLSGELCYCGGCDVSVV